MLRAWLTPGSLFVALVLLLAGLPARAEEKAHGEESHAKPKYVAEVEVDGKEVEKSFDLSKPEERAALLEAIEHGHVEELKNDKPPTLKKLFSLSADLGIWSLVVFCLLMYALSKLAWPKMLAGLKKREERIRGAQEEAQKTRDEAHALHLQLQKDMSEANVKAAQVIDEGRKVAQATADEIVAKARTEIQAERERLQREIQMQTDQAIQRIWSQTADIATLISAKALGRGVTVDNHRKLIDEALAEIQASSGGANGHA
jgi:F-type H+-transporting ATPase subunit b